MMAGGRTILSAGYGSVRKIALPPSSNPGKGNPASIERSPKAAPMFSSPDV